MGCRRFSNFSMDDDAKYANSSGMTLSGHGSPFLTPVPQQPGARWQRHAVCYVRGHGHPAASVSAISASAVSEPFVDECVLSARSEQNQCHDCHRVDGGGQHDPAPARRSFIRRGGHRSSPLPTASRTEAGLESGGRNRRTLALASTPSHRPGERGGRRLRFGSS